MLSNRKQCCELVGVPDRASQTEKRDPLQHSKGNPGEDLCCTFGNTSDLALVCRRETPLFFE
jgi:hypothetical protein